MIVLGCDSINAIKLYNFIPYLCHSVGKSCNNSSFFPCCWMEHCAVSSFMLYNLLYFLNNMNHKVHLLYAGYRPRALAFVRKIRYLHRL